MPFNSDKYCCASRAFFSTSGVSITTFGGSGLQTHSFGLGVIRFNDFLYTSTSICKKIGNFFTALKLYVYKKRISLHIALVSLSYVNVIVRLNFRYIIHYDKIHIFNIVNIENILKIIYIYSPREVTNYEE